MIFQIPDTFVGIGYYEGISLILWIVATVLMISSTIIFMIKAIKIQEKSAKSMFIAYGLFYIFFGLTRILYIEAVYILGMYDFFTTLGYITQILALIFIIYVLETQIVKSTKNFFLIITIVAFVIALISLVGVTSIRRYFALTLLFILVPISASVIMILYLYVIIKSIGGIRKKAIGLFIGSLMMFASQVMDSEMFISATFPFVPLEITPIIMIIGVIIFTLSQVKS